MDFQLNNALPIWKQLAEQLKERIVTGEYPAGTHFPTVRDLAAEAGVNPNTMQRAMVQLENDGLIITNRTSGRVVTDDRKIIDSTRTLLALERTDRFFKDMKALGYNSDAALKFVKEGM
ncbi:MAG: GntR family transcriptional regulator [Lachnospiraceae bacterium]|nr:GntR family transcriptional regulator [Lachnospiraceae bacterium]